MASTDPSPGILDRIAATIAAARRVVTAHVTLARTELGSIAADVAGVVARVAAALAILFFVGILVSVGTMLLLGEWLFGSFGWGILHGSLFLGAMAVELILGALGLGRGRVGRILLALLVAVGAGVALGSGWAREGWSLVAEELFLGIEPDWRVFAAAFVGGAVVVGVLGALIGLARGRLGGLIGGLVTGAVIGALLGALSLAPVDAGAGAGIGVTAALVVWLTLAVSRFGRLDPEALQARFTPSATMETAQETLAWLRTIRP
jgi:hypothetical protein